jgi:long-chain acyl-CoA synthetase
MNDNSTFRPAPWQGVHEALGVEPAPFDDRPLGAFVEEHAAQRPEAPALQYFHRSISYRELDEAASRFASALQSLGVGRGDVVGLHLPNVPQYPIALAAIAKLGATGSGVSPLLAPGELCYQVQDAGISVLVSLDLLAGTLQGAGDKLPACLEHIVQTSGDAFIGGSAQTREAIAGRPVHDFLELLERGSPDFRQVETHWNDTFMLQYTGGTTGRPKGAELSIRNLIHNPAMSGAYEPWQDGDEVLASAFPMFHAAGLAFAIAGMRYGGHKMLIPDPRNVEHFCQQMIQFPPTRLAGVPTIYMMLVNCPLSADIDFSRLRSAVSGAAPLPAADRERINALVGADKLSDVFGMTETGPVHVANPPQRIKPRSIGIPVPGADTRIVDLETGTQEMPFGEAGEIITSGPQVMKGYLNLPEESARALREIDGRTWMFTGDVGYMDDEGYITLCDRAKDMLIVGGYKVFSVEVEDKLKALDLIAESAVIGAPDPEREGNDIVNLYVQLTPDAADADPDELRERITAFCRAEMAPYKVPKRIHFVEQIPLTPVGKIDKKLLRSKLSA